MHLPMVATLVPAAESATLGQSAARKASVVVCKRTMGPPDYSAHDDDELLVRIADDDQTAFRTLVERHIDRAYALALRILKNAADAEDVVQDSMLKVWTNRSVWESGRAKFSTWLYRVITNRCIDLRRQTRTDGMDDMSDFVDERPDVVATMYRNEIGSLLEDALQRLPEQQKIAVVLSYHEGLSNAEVAEIMETTVSAVESLLKRGRQQLRHFLRGSEADILQSFADD